MKLRIRGNSIRLRLLRSEVERFGETGRIAETIQFGASPATQLIYALEADSEARHISANYADNKVTVTIPEKTARRFEPKLSACEASHSPTEMT